MKQWAILTAVFLLVLPAVPVSGQSPVNLFVSSFPYEAKIKINDEPLPVTTPALIKQLEPGRYEIEISHEGYVTSRATLTIDGDTGFAHHKVTLMPLYIKIPITSGTTIVNNEVAKTGKYGFMIPQGSWDINYQGDRIKLDPAYPHQNKYTAAKTATIILSALFASMTVYDLVSPVERDAVASPFTFVSLGLSLSAGAFWTGYAIDKEKYLQSVTSLPLDTYPYVEFGSDKYTEAEKLLAAGNMYGAIDAYTEVIAEYPGSNYIPGALYKTAKIDEILGNLTRAGLSYRALIETYPIPEYYDKSCAALAGILERQSKFNEAAEYLERMIFYDPSFSKDEIEDRIEELESMEEKL